MSDFKSNETNSIPDSSSAKTDSARQSLLKLIPPYVRDVCKKPTCAELRVSYDAPTRQTTYTYSITWDSDVDNEEKVQEMMTARLSMSKLTGGSVPPVDARCDGPCRRVFKSNLLIFIGRCDHYLCNACYGIVVNKDGTAGCSAYECNWKGTSREEAKKFYETEICRKQRERAKAMKQLGIDVKVASAASSLIDVTSEKAKSTEANCSVTPSTLMENCPPPTVLKISTLLVMLEASERGEMVYKFSTKTMSSTLEMLKALTKLCKRKQLNAVDCLTRGTLYYAQERPDKERELHLIDRRDFDELFLYHFPKIENEVVFVLDFYNFVENGHEVYFG